MESLQQSIEAYELQLKQVKDAILASSGDASQNNDLVSLKDDLDQLISLTKQNLLELKKEELLKQLECYDDSSEGEKDKETTQRLKEDHYNNVTLEQKEDPSIGLSSLEGVKCQAPFKSLNSANEFYHNAIIFAVHDDITDNASSYETIKVRVVFSNPTCQKMIPCKYYIDGRCNYSEDKCRHSHGEVVSLATLKEFCDPDYDALKEGMGILAKDESSNLWKHANVEGVEYNKEMGTTVHVRFSHDNKKIITLSLEDVVPLTKASEGESGSEEDGESDGEILAFDQNRGAQDVRNLLDIIDGSASAMGTWESHTKGIGSKLMASMGYIHGTGLGKDSGGRVEPVPIMIYPSGCSIDYCMNIKEKYSNSESGKSSIFSAEKVLEKARRKEEVRNLRKLEKEKTRAKREESFFDLLNSKLVRRDNISCDKASTSANLSKKSFPLSKNVSNNSFSREKIDQKSHEKALKIEGIKTFDEIKRKEKQIEKLNESLKRNKNSGDRNILSQKLQQEKQFLSDLKSRENSINQEKSKHVNRRKLDIF
jgi:hypothetical protein